MDVSLHAAVTRLLTETTPECEQVARHVLSGQGRSPNGPTDEIDYRGRIALAFSHCLALSAPVFAVGTTSVTDAESRQLRERAYRHALAAAFSAMSDEVWIAVVSAIAGGPDARESLLARWVAALDRVPEQL